VFDPENDLRFAEAMVADLKPYLLSDTLYWTLDQSGATGRPFPKGTLGGLLLRLHRLKALIAGLTPDQARRLELIQREADEQLDRWRVQTEQKALREMKARLGLWAAYLDECERDLSNENYRVEYPTQVVNRTILAFLADVVGRAIHGTSISTRIILLDQRLGNITSEGDFAWDEVLIPAFPRDAFWWLYVRLNR
jgi:hypothetical protein